MFVHSAAPLTEASINHPESHLRQHLVADLLHRQAAEEPHVVFTSVVAKAGTDVN
jgi:hypothetical protein